MLPVVPALLVMASCGTGREGNRGGSAGDGGREEMEQQSMEMQTFDPVTGKVVFMNLDPGHFHASLVQKKMYDQVDPTVYVFAPDGPEVENYLAAINDYNTRGEDPTSWVEKVYKGADYLEKMIAQKPGNVMVVSGNNAKKTEYILEAVKAGIYVLADKPMVISPGKFPMLEEAFETAQKNGVLIYDIMTERYEITTRLQKELAHIPSVFGQLETGTAENPAITKESVHHFFKYVSGKALVRPPWFFDVSQQGEGIVDVTTHLVDLIQWEAFPGTTLRKEDVQILSAGRWTTDLTPEMFMKVTGLSAYPDYLMKDVDGDILKVYSNGEIDYTLKGIHCKVSVTWNFQAPEGTGDTHYSVMRGSLSSLVIRQGAEEGYKPMLYIEPNGDADLAGFETDLESAVSELTGTYPGLELKKLGEGKWQLRIPDSYKVGHEAHFGQVTEKYLGFLASGELPAWEIPNMIVKYYTTTEGMKKAME